MCFLLVLVLLRVCAVDKSGQGVRGAVECVCTTTRRTVPGQQPCAQKEG